jgi:hypothetical protein
VSGLFESSRIEGLAMKRKIFFAFITLILAFPGVLFAQKLAPSEILEKSKANLIVVGKLGGYGRTYNEYPSDYYDSTIAHYEIVQILKGEYKQTSIEVTFEGHLYLSEKENHILFLTDDKDSLGLPKKFANCENKSCFFSDVEWILGGTKPNITALEKLISKGAAKTSKITEEEAVKIAEKFIEANGYTSSRPAPDKAKITLESIEWSSDIKEILESRYNTLQPKAYGILKGARDKKEGFTVIFRLTDDSIKDVGRAVTMDSNGKNLRVEHKDIFLKAAEKVF